jgi:uncharacterized protein YecE (DUF72 family)
VPVDFRFLLKAPRACLFPTLGPAGERSTLNPSFLDGELAVREFVDPTLQALGERTGPLVFQFPAMNLRSLGGPVAFADRLGGFLRKLPRGPLYAVEVRNRELLGAAYRDALSGARVVHCFNVHPTMPSLEAQATAVGHDPSGTLVVRWMLGHGLPYETARDRYRPFNRLVAEDEATRAAIVAACRRTVAEKGEAVVIVNNKAEGCSPLSVVQLARLLVEG